MKTYALIVDKQVRQLFEAEEIEGLFEPSWLWIEVAAGAVQEGWVYDASTGEFTPPAADPAATPMNVKPL